MADVFGQYGVVGYELAVLVERADCVVQVDYEVLCAELSEIEINQKTNTGLPFGCGLGPGWFGLIGI